MAKYAHVQDGTITGVYDLLPENWRNISNFYLLENDSETLTSLGWKTIVKSNVSYQSDTQTLGNPTYTLFEDGVYEMIEVINLTPAVVVPVVALNETELLAIKTQIHEAAMQQLRIARDLLLADTDFTQLVDVIKINGELLTTEYETYRQSLRDLPNAYINDLDFVDILTVVYPVKPGVA